MVEDRRVRVEEYETRRQRDEDKIRTLTEKFVGTWAHLCLWHCNCVIVSALLKLPRLPIEKPICWSRVGCTRHRTCCTTARATCWLCATRADHTSESGWVKRTNCFDNLITCRVNFRSRHIPSSTSLPVISPMNVRTKICMGRLRHRCLLQTTLWAFRHTGVDIGFCLKQFYLAALQQRKKQCGGTPPPPTGVDTGRGELRTLT